MGKIYVNQTKVDLFIECKFDAAGVAMTNVTSHKINLVSPTGKKSELDAELSPNGKTIFYQLSEPILDEVGNWVMYPSLVFDDGRSADGEPSTFMIHKVIS